MLREAQRHAMQSATLRDKAREHVENWAKSSCLSLCTEMQSRLPRELRNMVYGSVFQDAGSFLASWPYPEGVLKDCPHLRDITYVGNETLVELAEEWHHYCIFGLDLDGNCQGLVNTGSEIWGLPGLEFARHIRHVEVEIRPAYSEARVGSDDSIGLPGGWRSLYKLQRPATLTLKADFVEWLDDPQPGDLHAQVVELLKDLIGAGINVTVKLEASHRSKPYSGSVGLEHLENDMWCDLLWLAHGSPSE